MRAQWMPGGSGGLKTPGSVQGEDGGGQVAQWEGVGPKVKWVKWVRGSAQAARPI